MSNQTLLVVWKPICMKKKYREASVGLKNNIPTIAINQSNANKEVVKCSFVISDNVLLLPSITAVEINVLYKLGRCTNRPLQ